MGSPPWAGFTFKHSPRTTRSCLPRWRRPGSPSSSPTCPGSSAATSSSSSAFPTQETRSSTRTTASQASQSSCHWLTCTSTTVQPNSCPDPILMSAYSIVLGILPPHFPPASQQVQRWSTTAGRSTEGWPTPARRADQCLFTDTTTRTPPRLDTPRSRPSFTAVLGLCSVLLGRQSFCLKCIYLR